MEGEMMKLLRMHLAEMAVAVLFVLLVVCFYRINEEGKRRTGNIPYNEDWICVTEEGSIDYPKLPKLIEMPEGREEVVLKKELGDEVDNLNSIGFFTSHQEVDVFVDRHRIYQKKAPKYVQSKTPGNCWSFIPIREDYRGKLLEIRLKNCYDLGYLRLPKFMYGPRSSIVVQQIEEKALSWMFGVGMMVVGLMLVISWGTIGKKMHFHEGILWLGLFTVYFSIWSTMETQLPALVFERELLCSQITFMMLKLMLLPIVCFIRVVYQMKGSRLWNAFAWLGVLDFAVSFTGQFFGWFDYREGIWFTHLLGIAVILAAAVCGVRILVERRREIFHQGHKVYRNVLGICLVGGCMLVDAVNYYQRTYSDVAAFSRVGCLLFVLFLTAEFLEDSMKLIEAGKQAETLKEEAERDGLTMLKNRRIFEIDLNNVPESKLKKCAIVMFDLNNLKRMNDEFGHHMGDYYIISASEIIQDVFGSLGEIYRIGGDEFCLIANGLARQEYSERAQRMCCWIASLKGAHVDGLMQIASGFAAFNRNTDRNLLDTMERADKEMYQCKRRQKAQNVQGGGN
ncbi:MAG: diguanylate cyclase [Lachnospiraceae bacterium]|nr:diguanylate cyclase [Lachnospiraceae bacterium]